MEKLVRLVRKLAGDVRDDCTAAQYKTCEKQLTKIKILLTSFKLLPPFGDDAGITSTTLACARETYELACLLSIFQGKVRVFERNFSQLRPYYCDFGSLMPPSDAEHEMIAFNLMYLLTENRMSDFHSEIELLSAPESLNGGQKNVAISNKFVAFPIQLEQYLAEGSYNSVLSAAADMPSKHMFFFMDKLIGTVRERISACSEKAYLSMSVKEAQMLLKFDSTADVMKHAEERGWSVSDDGMIDFPSGDDTQLDIPSHRLITHALAYATDLERII